jgi:hypothetical protein
MLGDPSVQIRFVEGVKKADALASRGCCAIASTGVWVFKGKNPLGGSTVLGDFDCIALKGRECDIITIRPRESGSSLLVYSSIKFIPNA